MVIEIPPSTSYATHSAEEEPLLSGEGNDDAENPQERAKAIKKELHSPRFELNVARISLVVDIIAYGSMVLLASQTAFVAFGLLGALGVGFSPATQTLALAMYARRGGTETGRLFGALSVVQALRYVLQVLLLSAAANTGLQWPDSGSSGVWLRLHKDGSRLPQRHLLRGPRHGHHFPHSDELHTITSR